MKNKIKILSILFTTNNTLYSLTDIDGKVIFWTSSGIKKIKGAKKVTSISALVAAKTIIKYLLKFNYKNIYLKIKGFNKNKKLIIKYFNQSFLNILLITDKTSFPHNGCKNPKKRRV